MSICMASLTAYSLRFSILFIRATVEVHFLKVYIQAHAYHMGK